MAVTISLEKLLEAGAHFGHQYKRWNPKMAEYMYAVKEGIYVFDLLKTRERLEEALEVLTQASRDNKVILFVATKKQAKSILAEISKETGCLYIDERWPGGLLTNFVQIRKSLDNLEVLTQKRTDAAQLGYTKKEQLLMDRKITKIRTSFGGVLKLDRVPDLIVVIDTHREKGAVSEARQMKVPTIGVVDSNANPLEVTYPIPMNDDAAKSLEYVLELMKEAILDGKKAPAKVAKKQTTEGAKKVTTPKKKANDK